MLLINSSMNTNCKYCHAPCKNRLAIAPHQNTCRENPNRHTPWVNATFGFGNIPWNKGKTKADDPRIIQQAAALSLSTKGKPTGKTYSVEQREQISKRQIQFYKEHPEKHPNRKMAGNRKSMTYPEKVAADWLLSHGIQYRQNERLLRYYLDFTVGKIIVEIDGERWHNEEVDAVRDSEIRLLGYEVYRIKAKDRIEDRLKEIFKDHVL